MGSGKSTTGKKLATQLKVDFYDLDAIIEKKEGKTIQQLFEEIGEHDFRELESKALKQLVKLLCKNSVISLGGGTVCFNDNLSFIKENGVLVYLKANAKTLFNRLVNAKSERPLLKGKTEEELLSFIEENLQGREPFYSQANIQSDIINLSIESLISQIEKI